MKKTGGCLCGQVRYETRLIQVTGVCHCKTQKQAGSAFSTLAAFQMADIEFSGVWRSTKTATRTREILLSVFCGTCGSHCSTSPAQPDMAYLNRDPRRHRGFCRHVSLVEYKQNWVELSPDVLSTNPAG